jgi:uncharacterized protein (DUF3084 family)
MNYALQENWKRRWAQDTKILSIAVEQQEAELVEQSSQRAQAEVTLRTKSNELDKSRAETEILQSKIQQQAQTITNLETRVNQQADQIVAQTEEIAAKENSLKLARERINELNTITQVSRAVAFQLNVKLSELEDDNNNLQVDLTKREEELAEMREDLSQKTASLQLVSERYPDIYRDVTSEAVGTDQVLRGLVAAVRLNAQGKQDLAMLTIGSDDGVKEGTEFIIYRGNKYIVKGRVEKVFPDMAALSILQDTWNVDGALIQQGDAAQNRLF